MYLLVVDTSARHVPHPPLLRQRNSTTVPGYPWYQLIVTDSAVPAGRDNESTAIQSLKQFKTTIGIRFILKKVLLVKVERHGSKLEFLLSFRLQPPFTGYPGTCRLQKQPN
eukprot:402767-Rhodomonas_salina.1